MIPKKTKTPAVKVTRKPGPEFMILTECEGQCEVGTMSADRRKRCRRLDTVEPIVFVANGTREGEPHSFGRICMKHLPQMIATIKREAPGGNGSEFHV